MTVKVEQKDWQWFGHAGHFICAHWCRFHLCTKVGDYLVSTVGEYWPERSSREIHARIHDPAWLARNQHRKGDDFDLAYMERFGFEDIGFERKYETMVFKAGKPCTSAECGCGLPKIDSSELDFGAYNDAGTATRGHLAICERWSEPPEGVDDAIKNI